MGGNEIEISEHHAGGIIATAEDLENTEANVTVYDLNQKTMQALQTLAAFEKAGENLDVVNSEGHVLFADVRATMDEFNGTEPRTHVGSVAWLPGMSRQCLHGHVGVLLKIQRLSRVTEATKKADNAQDQVRAHRERCRRVSAEYGTAEEDLNECLGGSGPARTQYH